MSLYPYQLVKLLLSFLSLLGKRSRVGYLVTLFSLLQRKFSVMSSISVTSRSQCSTSLPGFAFQPKDTYGPRVTEVIKETFAEKQPLLRYSTYRDMHPTPHPTEMSEITIPISPLDMRGQIQSGASVKNVPTLLTIPLEIRLQIYTYVIESHPIQDPHLSSTFYHQSTTFPARQVELYPHTTTYPPTLKQPHITELKTPSIPHYGKIPTGLLGACRQTYGETHALPFQTNNFAFTDWFFSGIYAARQFSRSLRSWQRDAVRWVQIDVVARDLVQRRTGQIGAGIGVVNYGVGGYFDREKGVSEWLDLCRLWECVWGLRLKIGGRVLEERKVKWVEENGIWVEKKEAGERKQEKGVLSVENEWVVSGLGAMRDLRWIELEIEDESVVREEKIAFCGRLGLLLREGRERAVNIALVEKVKVQENGNKDVEWSGAGEVGDDEAWGMDM
jgi:hypothetical protein